MTASNRHLTNSINVITCTKRHQTYQEQLRDIMQHNIVIVLLIGCSIYGHVMKLKYYILL